VELEALAAPMTGLNFSFNLAYTDAEFTDFPDAPCYPGELLVAGNGCQAVGVSFVQNLKGAALNNAPKGSYNLGGSYTRLLNWRHLSGFVEANYAYRSSVNFNLDQDPNTVQKGYGVFSVNLGAQTPGQRIRVALFARNLFDQHHASYILSKFVPGRQRLDARRSQPVLPEAARRIVGVAVSGKF
jgi:iron complex outermembrane receptor protein